MLGTSQSRNAKFRIPSKKRKMFSSSQALTLRHEANELCLNCGLCCNGGIFADVALEPTESVSKYETLGLVFGGSSNRSEHAAGGPPAKFLQPCRMFQKRACGIYSQRPAHCRKFDCMLLREVVSGEIDFLPALRIVRQAADAHDRLVQMLRALGERDESSPVRSRFETLAARLEAEELSRDEALAFGDLTIAMHEFNVLISERFYAGEQ